MQRQQGVPLVDADWNELRDVTRNRASISPSSFDDIAPRPVAGTTPEVSFPPVYHESFSIGQPSAPWNIAAGLIFAFKPAQANALGCVPLPFPTARGFAPSGTEERRLRLRTVRS